MTWFANVLILIGLFLNGGKHRACFVFAAVGELIWTAVSVTKSQWDLAAICVVFAIMAVINFFRWGRQTQGDQT